MVNIHNSDIEIIGNGNIGDKARQLLEKTQALKEIGFYVPRRTVLAEDFFDGFFQKNGLGSNLQSVVATEDLESKIRNGKLSRQEFEILSSVCSSYSPSPLAIRSSAEGDSRGTGIYRTGFAENHFGRVRKTLQEVLASYFSQDAIAFRRDANTEEGFGGIIEPIIGQDFGWCFAPALSGFGYTSTSRGGSYVNIVPGLGGGVESRYGEKISREIIERFGGSLEKYIEHERDSMFSLFPTQSRRNSALLRTDRDLLSDSYSAVVYFPPTKYNRGHVSNGSITLEGNVGHAFYRLNLIPFFDMMARMEKTFGKPQYFEWAMTIEEGKPIYSITQVANVNKKLDIMDFSDLGEIIFTGHTVAGTGVKECYKIANCWNPSDIPALREFNRNNQNYVLLFSSGLTTGGGNARMKYSDFNNASVFLEIQDARHVGDPVAHLGGQLDTTRKLFGVLDYREENMPNWQKFESREQEEMGIKVYQGKVKVIASERQNKMVVSALD